MLQYDTGQSIYMLFFKTIFKKSNEKNFYFNTNSGDSVNMKQRRIIR